MLGIHCDLVGNGYSQVGPVDRPEGWLCCSFVIAAMAYSLEFGLVNAANRYLTAEPFRFQVTATGLQLKPRQVWIVQFVNPQGAGAAGPGEGAGQKLHLISALKRYLAADANGKVTCDQDKPGPQTFFLLHQYPDGKVCSCCHIQNHPISIYNPFQVISNISSCSFSQRGGIGEEVGEGR